MERKKDNYEFQEGVELHGYQVTDSDNVEALAWSANGMYVRFRSSPSWYFYEGVTRQRAVAMARTKSVGKYLNKYIKPNYKVTKLERGEHGLPDLDGGGAGRVRHPVNHSRVPHPA